MGQGFKFEAGTRTGIFFQGIGIIRSFVLLAEFYGLGRIFSNSLLF